MTSRPSRGFQRLSLAAALVTFLLIVAGDIVRVSGSGAGCGGSAGGTDSWPLCRGGLVPAPDIQTVIEFSHRVFATASLILIAAVLIWAWVAHRRVGSLRLAVGATVAAVLLLVQIALGALTVESDLLAKYIFFHLANAELVFAAAVYVCVLAWTEGSALPLGRGDAGAGAAAGVVIAVAAFVVILSGAYVVDAGAAAGCRGWPLCGTNGGIGFVFPSVGVDATNFLHRVVVIIAAGLIGALNARILRFHRGEPGMRLFAMSVNILLLLQIIAGALVVLLQLAPWTQGIHLALASALWSCIVVVALLARRVGAVAADRAAETANAAAAPS